MSDKDYINAIPLTSAKSSPRQIKSEMEALNLQHHKEDHQQWFNLRNHYAYTFLWVVSLQILAMNLFFLFEPLLKISEGIFKTFSVSVFSEVVALALVVTRSIFPGKKSFRIKKIQDSLLKTRKRPKKSEDGED
jgi:hypothetical protein